jgi:HAD superfamily hydrolase (TIGR01509 family)
MNEFHDIEAILFDMDGTITDLGKRWWDPFFRAFVRLKPNYDTSKRDEEFENSIADVIKTASGKSRFLRMRIVWKVTRAMRLNLFETYKLLRYMRADPLAFKEIIPLPNADRVIKDLHSKGYKLAIVTTAGQEIVTTALNKYKFFNLFDTIVTRNDVKHTKPHPQQLFLACENMKCNPKKSVMIGDFPQDIQAGKAAGCKTIGILGLNGKYTAQLLEEEQPDLIVNQIEQILPLFL